MINMQPELKAFIDSMGSLDKKDLSSWIYESTEEEKEAHRQMIIKQREELLKKG